MSSLLFRNARIARPGGTIFEGDVLCNDGIIERIEKALTASADETLDARGRLLLPGIIDTHVHFREPGHEYKEDLASGSRAAAKGGVTSFLEMPNTHPPTISQAALDDKLRRAARSSVVNYGFFIGATRDNLVELNRASPVCGIKIFMGCSTGNLLVHTDEDLERIFATGRRVIAVHAEDEARLNEREQQFAGSTDPAVHSEIRDSECAVRATRRALTLAEKYRRRLHIMHLSTHDELMLLRQHKPSWVKAEVIPNHLFLNTGDYEGQGTLVQMNPPLRGKSDNEALWRGLHDGIIDFMGSDHAPHGLEEKRHPYPASPSGMPGVETSLPLLLTEVANGKCTLSELLAWMCSGPAEAYGIANKGRIEEGYDADLTLADDKTMRTVQNQDLFTKVRWSPYQGRELTGWPVVTVVGGRIVYDQGRIREGVRGQALQFREPGSPRD